MESWIRALSKWPSALLLGVVLAPLAIAFQVPHLIGLTPEEKEILSHMSLVYLDDGLGGQVKTLRISDINLQIVNGLGATNGNPFDPDTTDPALTLTNGLGNLIVGYNELGNPLADDRSGSHNLVFGHGNSFSSFGGLVGPHDNSISGVFASVTSGTGNVASGPYSAVVGGTGNTASGEFASVSGGVFNTASNTYASVSGGKSNTARGMYSTVSGGWYNTAGSRGCSVSGGAYNTANGLTSSISGGRYNDASGKLSSISGGKNNTASGKLSSVNGGFYNSASGYWSTVSGGAFRTAADSSDWAAGSLLEDY